MKSCWDEKETTHGSGISRLKHLLHRITYHAVNVPALGIYDYKIVYQTRGVEQAYTAHAPNRSTAFRGYTKPQGRIMVCLGGDGLVPITSVK